MITCEQRRALREQTLRNLGQTDWADANVILQVDRGAFPEAIDRIRDTARLALERGAKSGADYVLFLEDDLDFNRRIRHNLDAWPPLQGCEITLASLANPDVTRCLSDPGRNCFVADPAGVWGSQAYLISQEAVTFILEHWDDADVATLMPDLKMPRLAGRLGPIYYHAPSLVEHCGERSTWGGEFRPSVDFDRWWQAPSPLAGQARAKTQAGFRPCVVTVATRPDRHYAQFWRSCLRWRIQPVVLGQGVAAWSEGLNWRLVRRFGHEHAGHFTHLIFCDGYDLIWNGGLDEVMECYRRFAAPLVLGAEREAGRAANDGGPSEGTDGAQARSGFWIGQSDLVMELLDQVDPGRLGSGSNESSPLGQLLALGRGRIALDHSSVLCQAVKDAPQDLAYDAARQRIFNRRTGTYPCVVHGSGGADMTPLFGWLNLEAP